MILLHFIIMLISEACKPMAKIGKVLRWFGCTGICIVFYDFGYIPSGWPTAVQI